MLDSTYPAYPVLAILGAVLVLIPLPWHFQAWNSGTCLYMFWTALSCLNYGINSIVWRSSALNFAPVWCDISSRIIVVSAVAIPAASLCINRRLYHILTTKSVSISRAEKRRAILVDLAIGLGIPISQIIFQYIVSGHRFDVFEQIGCYPFTYNTALAYPLSILWPIIIGLVSAVYCLLTLAAFYRRRVQFMQCLAASSGLTAHRYFRLMALASVELLCTIPISAYGISLNATAAPLYPWISWANVHYDYSQVNEYPAVIWRLDPNNVVAFGLSTWAAPFCAFVFFAFFGFAEEARKNYYQLWLRARSCILVPLSTFVTSRFGWRKDHHNSLPSPGLLPVYTEKPPLASPTSSMSSAAQAIEEKKYVTLPDTPAEQGFSPDAPKKFVS